MSNEKFKVKYGLEVQTGEIVSSASENIKLDPASGTTLNDGHLIIGQLNTNAILNTNGNGNLQLKTGSTNSGIIEIAQGDNGNITIDPHGTGKVVISGDLQVDGTTTTINSTTLDVDDINITVAKGAANAAAANGAGLTVDGASATITYASADDSWNLNKKTAVAELQVDNINVSGNTISSTDTNGDISLTPNGTGEVNITKVDIDSGSIDGTTIGASSAAAGTFTTVTVDNINIDGNTIISTDTNGNITLDPNGTGVVAVVGDLTATAITASKSISTGNTSLTASDFIVVTNTMSATGTVSTPVDVNGLLAGNNSSSTNSLIINRSYGQNLPSGTTATSPNSQLVIEGSRGTPASPLALATNNVVGTLSFGGYDGTRFTSTEAGAGSLQLFGLASGAWTHDGTYTTNAGSTATLRNQPQDLRLTSASRQNIFNSTWTAVASAPPTQNIVWNSATMATQYDTVGTAYNGHGKQAHTFFHPTISIFGVPSQDTGADNTNITGTNVINIYANRQSGWSGRRDNVLSGDTLASINVFGQTGTNSTGVGSQAGTILFSAAENFGASNRGSTLSLQTGNVGTNTLATRLSLSSTSSTISTDTVNILGSTVSATPYQTQIYPSTGSANGEIILRTASTDGSKKSSFNFGSYRFNGTDLSATQSGDVLGEYKFNGNTATTGSSPGVPGAPGANIVAAATENWSSTANGTKFTFSAIKNTTLNSIAVIDAGPTSTTFQSDNYYFKDSAGTSYMEVDSTRILNNRPHRSAVTTASQARGTTYTPAAGVNNFIELELTSGTDPTYIDVDNLSVANEGGHCAILVYNNSGSSIGNGDLRLRNNGTQISTNSASTIANGARGMFTIYFVGNYAACEFMDAA